MRNSYSSLFKILSGYISSNNPEYVEAQIGYNICSNETHYELVPSKVIKLLIKNKHLFSSSTHLKPVKLVAIKNYSSLHPRMYSLQSWKQHEYQYAPKLSEFGQIISDSMKPFFGAMLHKAGGILKMIIS